MSGIAFFGKVPFAADFVRRGISPPLREFENWLHDGVADLRSAGAKWVSGRCCFLYPSSGGKTIAAVAIPSRDRIGREFPAVAGAVIETGNGGLHRSVAVLGCKRFYDEASAAMEAHMQSDADALWSAIQNVRPPSSTEMSDAEGQRSTLLDEESARAMEDVCFAGPDDRFYGYHALRLAARDAPPPDPRVLVCPTAGEIRYSGFWAEAIEQATQGRIPLPMLWTEGSLVVGLGRAPKSMLRFGAGLGGSSSALWPLTTEYQSARERSKAALQGQFWDDPEQKLGRLIDSILRIQL